MTPARLRRVPSWLAAGAVLIALLGSGHAQAQACHDRPPNQPEGTGAGDMVPPDDEVKRAARV